MGHKVPNHLMWRQQGNPEGLPPQTELIDLAKKEASHL